MFYFPLKTKDFRHYFVYYYIHLNKLLVNLCGKLIFITIVRPILLLSKKTFLYQSEYYIYTFVTINLSVIIKI